MMENYTSSEEENGRENTRPMCSYGSFCYRRNPGHFRVYRHPHPHRYGQPMNSSSIERIEVKMEISHKSTPLPEGNNTGETHDITVLVQGVDDHRIDHIIDKVVFHFANQRQTFIAGCPPFTFHKKDHESSMLSVDVHFKNRTGIDKVHYDYNVRIQDRVITQHVRRETMSFLNPDPDFRENLLRAGGVILQEAGSSSSTPGEAATAGPSRRKRRRANEGPDANEYEYFGSQCATKLKKVQGISPRQKIIAEKLISDVFCYAQLDALTTNSCIDSLKRSKDFFISQREALEDDLTETDDELYGTFPSRSEPFPIKEEFLSDSEVLISVKDEPLSDNEVSPSAKDESPSNSEVSPSAKEEPVRNIESAMSSKRERYDRVRSSRS